jgi:hypothetical protein
MCLENGLIILPFGHPFCRQLLLTSFSPVLLHRRVKPLCLAPDSVRFYRGEVQGFKMAFKGLNLFWF